MGAVAIVERGTEYQLTPERERFCQLRAVGKEPLEAYWYAYRADLDAEVPTDLPSRDTLAKRASYLLGLTTIRLRIQELQQPAVRRMRHKLEYTVQAGLRQCQIAYDLAYEEGNAGLILKCVEMQSKLAKLLSEEINVNHKHGLLDDASTATLLAMRAAFDKAARKQVGGPIVEGEVVSGTPVQAAL